MTIVALFGAFSGAVMYEITFLLWQYNFSPQALIIYFAHVFTVYVRLTPITFVRSMWAGSPQQYRSLALINVGRGEKKSLLSTVGACANVQTICDLIWENPAYCYFRENRDKAMFL